MSRSWTDTIFLSAIQRRLRSIDATSRHSDDRCETIPFILKVLPFFIQPPTVIRTSAESKIVRATVKEFMSSWRMIARTMSMGWRHRRAIVRPPLPFPPLILCHQAFALKHRHHFLLNNFRSKESSAWNRLIIINGWFRDACVNNQDVPKVKYVVLFSEECVNYDNHCVVIIMSNVI